MESGDFVTNVTFDQVSTLMALKYTDENVVTNLEYIKPSDHESSNCSHCTKAIDVDSKLILRFCNHSFHYKCFIKHHIQNPGGRKCPPCTNEFYSTSLEVDGRKCPPCTNEFYFTSLEVDGTFDSKIEAVISNLEEVAHAKRIKLHENVIAIPVEASFYEI